MGARHKLNQAYFNGSLIIAGVVGLATESFGLFVVVLGVLIMCNMHSGEIRLDQNRNRKNRR